MTERIGIVIPFDMAARSIITKSFISELGRTPNVEYVIISSSKIWGAIKSVSGCFGDFENLSWSEIYQPRKKTFSTIGKLCYILGAFIYLLINYRFQSLNGSNYLQSQSNASNAIKLDSLVQTIPLFRIFGFPFPKNKFIYARLKSIYEIFSRQHKDVEQQLLSLNLDNLVVLHCQNHKSNLYSAISKKLQVPVKGIVTSWDQPTTRGPILDVYTHIAVQSAYVAKQLEKYQFVEKNRIAITSMPYLTSLYRKSRKKTISEEKFVLFGMYPDRLGSHEPDIAYEILKHLNEKHPTTTLLLKPHPNDVNFFDRLGDEIIYNKQSKVLSSSFDDTEFYLSLLQKSSCVVSSGGSIGVEAPFFGIPSFSINFSLQKNSNTYVGIRYQLEHLIEAERLGLCQQTLSVTELINSIDLSLNGDLDNSVEQETLFWLFGDQKQNNDALLRNFITTSI